MQPKVGIGILVLHQDNVLLGKRKNTHGDGTWACPGGHLEFGETVEKCIKRELLEETGLFAEDIFPGPWKEVIFSNEKKHYLNIYGFVTKFSGSLQNKEPEKNESWLWFPIENLPSPLFEPLKKIVIENSLSAFLDEHLEKTHA